MPDRYCIKDGYQINEHPRFFDDTPLKDQWQDEVYRHARDRFEHNNYQSVLDLGTGSGYKLIKYFGTKHDVVGIDLHPTTRWLNVNYPARTWLPFSSDIIVTGYDLLVCADVLEHVVDPDIIMTYIRNAGPKLVVLSTPDRDRLPTPNGPPSNPCHCREWSFAEFQMYVGVYFNIIDHFISNEAQATQCVVAKLR